MPDNTVYVGRPTAWGNPWRVGRDGDAKYCADNYRRAITGGTVDDWPNDADDADIAVSGLPDADCVRLALRGKNLACWCPLDKPCHADVLLMLANQEADHG